MLSHFLIIVFPDKTLLPASVTPTSLLLPLLLLCWCVGFSHQVRSNQGIGVDLSVDTSNSSIIRNGHKGDNHVSTSTTTTTDTKIITSQTTTTNNVSQPNSTHTSSGKNFTHIFSSGINGTNNLPSEKRITDTKEEREVKTKKHSFADNSGFISRGSEIVPPQEKQKDKQITEPHLLSSKNPQNNTNIPQKDDVHIKIIDTDARNRRDRNRFRRPWSRRNRGRYWRPSRRGRHWSRRRWRPRSNITTPTPNKPVVDTGDRRVIITKPEQRPRPERNQTDGGISIPGHGVYSYWNVPPFVLEMRRKLEQKIRHMSHILYNGLSDTLYDISRRSKFLIKKYAIIKEDAKHLISETYDITEDIVSMSNKIYDTVLSISAFDRRLFERVYDRGHVPTAGSLPDITDFSKRDYNEINRDTWLTLRTSNHMRNKFIQLNHTYAKHISYLYKRLAVMHELVASQRTRVGDLMDIATYVNNQMSNLTKLKVPKDLREIYNEKHALVTANYQTRHQLFISEQLHQDVTISQKSCYRRLEELSKLNYTHLKNIPRPTIEPLSLKEKRKLQLLTNRAERHTENILRTAAEIDKLLPSLIKSGKELILKLSMESQSDSPEVRALEKMLKRWGKVSMSEKSTNKKWMKMRRRRIMRMRKRMPKKLKHLLSKRHRRSLEDEDADKIYDEIIKMLTDIIKKLDDMWMELFQESPGVDGKCKQIDAEGSGEDDTEVECEMQGSGKMGITESDSGTNTRLSLAGNKDDDDSNDFEFTDVKRLVVSSHHDHLKSIISTSLSQSKSQHKTSRNLLQDVKDIKSSLNAMKAKKMELESDVNESVEAVNHYQESLKNATEMRRLLNESEEKINISQMKCSAAQKLAELVLADKDELERLLEEKKKAKNKKDKKEIQEDNENVKKSGKKKKKKLADKTNDNQSEKKRRKDKEDKKVEIDISKKLMEENEKTKAELRILIEKYLQLQKKDDEREEEERKEKKVSNGDLKDTNKRKTKKHRRKNKSKNHSNRDDREKKNSRKNSLSDFKEEKKRKRKKKLDEMRKRIHEVNEKRKNKIGKRKKENDELQSKKGEEADVNKNKKKKTATDNRKKEKYGNQMTDKNTARRTNEKGSEIDVDSVLEIKKNLEDVLKKLNHRLVVSKKRSQRHQRRRKKKKTTEKRNQKPSMDGVALADKKMIDDRIEGKEFNDKEEKGNENEDRRKKKTKKSKNKIKDTEEELEEEDEMKNEELNNKKESRDKNEDKRKKRRKKSKNDAEDSKKDAHEEEGNDKMNSKELNDKDKSGNENKNMQKNRRKKSKNDGKDPKEDMNERERNNKKKKEKLNDKDENGNENEDRKKKNRKKSKSEVENPKEDLNEGEENDEQNLNDNKRKKKKGRKKAKDEVKDSKKDADEEENDEMNDKEQNEKNNQERRKKKRKKSKSEVKDPKDNLNDNERNDKLKSKALNENEGDRKKKRKKAKNGVKDSKKDDDEEEESDELKSRLLNDKEESGNENEKKRKKKRKKAKNEDEDPQKSVGEEEENNKIKSKDLNNKEKNRNENEGRKKKKERKKSKNEDLDEVDKNDELKNKESNDEGESQKENKGGRKKKRKKSKNLRDPKDQKEDLDEEEDEEEREEEEVVNDEMKKKRKKDRNGKKRTKEEGLKNESTEKKSRKKDINEEKDEQELKKKKKKDREKNDKPKRKRKKDNDVKEEVEKNKKERDQNDGVKQKKEKKDKDEKNVKKKGRRKNIKENEKNNREEGMKDTNAGNEKDSENNVKKKKKRKKSDISTTMKMKLLDEGKRRRKIHRKRKRILRKKIQNPPISIQNEQSLAEEMKNSSKQIEEDVSKSKTAVESIVKHLKEFSPDPCTSITKNVRQLRLNVSQIRQKIQLARTIVSSMKIPVSLNGENHLEVMLDPKDESREIQTSVEICIKPKSSNSIILGLQANNSISYSLALVDSKPLLTILDAKGETLQKLEPDTKLIPDNWYQLLIHRMGQNFSLSVNPTGSKSKGITVQKFIPDFKPVQIPLSLASLGGYPQNFPIDNSEKLKGCIAYLNVNGHSTNILSPLKSGVYPPVCKTGCESVANTSMVFEGNGFALLESDGIFDKTFTSVHLTFKTLQKNALLMAIKKNSELLLLVTLIEGNIQIESQVEFVSKQSQGINFSDGQAHIIQVTIEDELEIKTSAEKVEFEDKNASGDETLFEEGISLGGLVSNLMPESKYTSLTGCLSNISIDNKLVNLLYLKNGRHVYQGDCQENAWISCTRFTESSTPITLPKYDHVKSISLMISEKAQGVPLFFERDSKFSIKVQLTTDSVEVFNYENDESKTIPKKNGTEFWHLLHIEDQKANIQITLDGEQIADVAYTENTGGWFNPSNANDFPMVITVGGLPKDRQSSPKSDTFIGSISTLTIQYLPLNLQREFGSSSNLLVCAKPSVELLTNKLDCTKYIGG